MSCWKGIIFDLDGVVVSTDDCHYRAWKFLADAEGIPFDRTVNERLRGVSRMESLQIILEKSKKEYTPEEKIALADRKNEVYKKYISALTERDILPGVVRFLNLCRENKLRIAIGSSSKNTKAILKQVGLLDAFDAVVDGNDITHSKPDPEVFVKAAAALGLNPEDCLVVEDADAGIEAAVAAGMAALGVGSAEHCKKATYHAPSLDSDTARELLG